MSFGFDLGLLVRHVRARGLVAGVRAWWRARREIRALHKAYEPQRLADEARMRYVESQREKFMQGHQFGFSTSPNGTDIASCSCGWAGPEWTMTVHLQDIERDFRATIVRAA